jgi:hypothetical protein
MSQAGGLFDDAIDGAAILRAAEQVFAAFDSEWQQDAEESRAEFLSMIGGAA